MKVYLRQNWLIFNPYNLVTLQEALEGIHFSYFGLGFKTEIRRWLQGNLSDPRLYTEYKWRFGRSLATLKSDGTAIRSRKYFFFREVHYFNMREEELTRLLVLLLTID
jgi:hypothetical protein